MTFRTDRFSHIYIEQDLLDDPQAQRILEQLPDSVIIPVRQYHDVFSRPKQDYTAQKQSRSLILARRRGNLLYRGAPVCHSFGHRQFYYTSPALNCLYDCEYCWLKGMYGTANPVIFVNEPKEYLEEAAALFHAGDGEPLFVSFSYETDLFPLEPLTGFLKQLSALIKETPMITAEIRTKCAAPQIIQDLTPSKNLILAFTLSPREMIRRYEHGTSPLERRLAAANTALDQGFPVRFCFDPMILFPGWRDAYDALLEEIRETVDLSRITDFSIGSYRQSDQYQKRMRRRFPDSAVIQYPYETVNGYSMYPSPLRTELEEGFRKKLSAYADPSKIYLLEEDQ